MRTALCWGAGKSWIVSFVRRLPHLIRPRENVKAGGQEDLFRMHARAGLKPVISQVMPFADLKQAMELVESRQSIGKVVVLPD